MRRRVRIGNMNNGNEDENQKCEKAKGWGVRTSKVRESTARSAGYRYVPWRHFASFFCFPNFVWCAYVLTVGQLFSFVPCRLVIR